MFTNFLLVFSIFFNLNLKHPIHLTVTNLEYEANHKVFVAKIRLFKDDFSKILYLKYHQRPDFVHKNKAALQLIRRYLGERFLIYINGVQVPAKKYQIKDYKIQDLTLWITLKIPYRQAIKSVEIHNQLMTDLYPDQKNMLIFTYKSVQKAYTFNKKNNIKKINL